MTQAELTELITTQRDAALAAPIPYLLCFAVGAIAAWFAARLIYNQRIVHSQEVAVHLRELLDERFPPRQSPQLSSRRSRRMSLGLIAVFVGVAVALLGAILIAVESRPHGERTVSKPSSPPKVDPPTRDASAPSIVSPATAATREYTSRTARELLALYDGRTPLQGDRAMEPFKGKWIKVDGTVLTVIADGNVGSIVVLRDGERTIECRLDNRWTERVFRFNQGDPAKAAGRINPFQNGSQLYLADCELL